MSNDVISPADIERCQEAILKFLPEPVTEKQRQALKSFHAGNLQEVRANTTLDGDYEMCLSSLMNASKIEAVKCLQTAAESAIKYAGVADGHELYAKLSEILPDHFDGASQENG